MISTDYTHSSQLGAPQNKVASAKSDSDFEMFLKMLTTQITNQDPLNPMEGTDFAVQLATFSSVEQQTRTNQLLQKLAERADLSGVAQYGDWIGKEVRSTAAIQFSDQPLTLDIRPPLGVDQVILVAIDAHGQVVSREDIGPGEGQIEWFGLDAAGQKLADGPYRFEIEAFRQSALMATAPVPAYGAVTEARLIDGEVKLVLAGGAEIAASEVTALRTPNS